MTKGNVSRGELIKVFYHWINFILSWFLILIYFILFTDFNVVIVVVNVTQKLKVVIGEYVDMNWFSYDIYWGGK